MLDPPVEVATRRRMSRVIVLALLAASVPTGAELQPGAKALFHGAAASTSNPFGPVGIHYWFQNDAGLRFADPREAGAGVSLQMYVESNTSGFLGAWMTSEGTPSPLPLSPVYVSTRQMLEAREEHAILDPFSLRAPSTTRILVLFARSQTEQVATPAQASEKICSLWSLPARDGAPAIVHERDSTTPGEIGGYVVNRQGAQPGIEIEIVQ